MTLTLLTGRTPVHTDHGTENSLLPKPGSDGDLRLLGKVNEFFQAITEPAPLIAGAVAGPIFSVVRNPTLSWLLSKPAALATRGLGARLFSAAVALPGEIAAFGLTQRAVQYAIHPHSLDWSREALWHEAGGLALTFGLFKMHGRLAQTLLPKSLQNFQSLAGAVGMYSGILHSHLWEEHLGWREHSTWADKFTQSFETYLQLKAMGHITHHVMGPRYNAWVASLEAKADQKIFQSENSGPSLEQLAVTPEGIKIPAKAKPVPANDLNQKMSSTENEGPSFPDNELVSEPGTTDREQAISQMEFALKRFFKRDHSLERVEAAKFILEDQGLAAEAIANHFKEKFQSKELKLSELKEKESQGIELTEKELEEKGRIERELRGRTLIEKDIPDMVQTALIEVRQYDFKCLNEKSLQLANRLSYLVGELRREHRRSKGGIRAKWGTLLDSVELKQWSISRSYSEGEAVLANYLPKKRDAEFKPENYSNFIKPYQNAQANVLEYLDKYPEFEPILKNYRDPRTEDVPSSLKVSDFNKLVSHLDLSSEASGFFQDALNFDPFLRSDQFRPLYRILHRLKGGLDPQEYLDTVQPIQEYLMALRGLRSWLSRDAIQEINIADYLNSREGDSRSLESLSKKLSEKIQQRWEEAQTETKREGDLLESARALENYLGKLRGLLELLHIYRTPEPTLPPLKWEEVKARLIDQKKKGMIHPNVTDQLLNWLEVKEGHTKDHTLVAYRSEFLAGMLEFFFNDSRTLKEQEELNYLLIEICDRKDIFTIRNLAVRFHNYYRGMDTKGEKKPGKGSPISKPADENGDGRHENLMKALLEMSKIYEKNPKFRGPYFEILEKIRDTQQPHSQRLNAPIHLRIQTLLMQGFPVELLAHPSLGLEVIKVDEPDMPTHWEAITSIQENLVSKKTFNKWMDKMAHEVGQNLEQPYRVNLYIPRIGSEGVRKDAITWARDFLENHSAITEVYLYFPTTAQGRAVKDPLDPKQFAFVSVSRRGALTTQMKMEIYRKELDQGDLDVAANLAYYQLLKETDPEITLESEAFHCLLIARRNFPENETVAKEMWRVLEANYKILRALEHHKLSDYEDHDRQRNKYQLAKLELWARDPIQYKLFEWEKKEGVEAAILKGKKDLEEHHLKTGELIVEKVRQARQTGSGEQEGPKKGLLSLIQSKDWSLGSKDHFERIGLFLEAILGKPFPNLNLKEVFDLSPVGYETRDWQINFNPKRPHRFTLRAAIVPLRKGRSSKTPYSRPRYAILGKARATLGSEEEGSISIRIEGRSNLGGVRIVVRNMKVPMGHQGNGVGTLLVEKTISSGKELEAESLVYRNVENALKYALVKMGGRLGDNFLALSRTLFPPYVDKRVEELGLVGMDISAASSVQTGQEIAEAYLDPIKRKLTVYPRWDRQERRSDIFFKDAKSESPYQVGRQFFLERPVTDWEVSFDLKGDSPELKRFWKYYQHRFDLREGEVLSKGPLHRIKSLVKAVRPKKSSGDPEDPT